MNSLVTVGKGSDVLVQISCINTTASGSWMYINGSTIQEPLATRGISQDTSTGVLRIYPSSLMINLNQSSFVCEADGVSKTINFALCKGNIYSTNIKCYE